MKDFKNQSDVILTIERPLIELDNQEIGAMLMQAELLAERAKSTGDPESFAAKLLMVTALNMFEQVELELARRN
jgi:hypothetical protein